MPHNYIICTSQRSGKTWLARTLECLGTGGANEYVNALHRKRPNLVEAWDRGGLPGFVAEFMRDQTSSGAHRPAGLSLAWNEFSKLARKSDLSTGDLLDRLVELMGGDTRIIFLVRRDLVAQAVSRFLLRETGYAHSFQSKENRKSRASVDYDARQIFLSLAWSQKAYLQWGALLMSRPHCLVWYEELVSDTVAEVRRLLDYIGFGAEITDADIQRCAGKTTRIGDDINDHMIRRFLGEPDYQAKIAKARRLIAKGPASWRAKRAGP